MSLLAGLLLLSLNPMPAWANDPQEPNDSEAQATPISLGTEVRGELPETYEGPEFDFFRFTVSRSSQKVHVTLTYWGGLVDPPGSEDCGVPRRCAISISLKRSWGLTLISVSAPFQAVRNPDGTYTARLNYTFGAPGTYYLELMSPDEGRDSSYSVKIDSPDDAPTSPQSQRVKRLVAFGDSVTAGFGYRTDGSSWDASDVIGRCNLFGPVTACQAPATVSWPRFLADSAGFDEWENSAESGSSPEDWGTGRYRYRLDGLTARNPTVIGLTLGANPMLSWLLFQAPGQACLRVRSGSAFYQCLSARLEDRNTARNLSLVYRLALRAKMARVFVFRYHQTAPVSTVATGRRVRDALLLLNDAIDIAAADVQARAPGGARLQVVDPGDFSSHGCRSPEPWILDTDTCIHPTAAGMRAYAGALAAMHARARPPRQSSAAVLPPDARAVGGRVTATVTMRRSAVVTVRLVRRSLSPSRGWRVLAVTRATHSRGQASVSTSFPILSRALPKSWLRVEFIVSDADGRRFAGRVPVR